MKFGILMFLLLFTFSGTHAAMTPEEKASLQQESLKFEDENTKIREEHLFASRDSRIEHIKQLFALKVKNARLIDDIRGKLVIGEKAANEKIKNEIKEKQKDFKFDEKKFTQDFDSKNKKTNEEFKSLMEKRREEFKNRHKK